MSARLGWGLVLLAGSACGTSTPVPAEPGPPAYDERAAPIPLGSTGVASTPESPAAAPTESPPEPSPFESVEAMLADADEELTRDLPFLEKICRVGVSRYPEDYGPEIGGKVTLGCTCCAPFDECRPVTGARPEPRFAGDVYSLRHRHAGSFTAPGRTQTSATFFGCEPGSGNRGGTAVFEERSGAVELVAYRSAVNPDECGVLRAKDGHDLLACAWSDGQGGSAYTRLVVHDLAKEIEEPGAFEEIDTLLMDGVCFLDAGMPYVDTRLQKMSTVDVDGDGRKDLRVEVLHRGGVIAARDMEACRADDEVPYLPPTLPAPTAHRFDYVFDGATLRPTAATRATMERLYRARSKFWAQMNP